MIVLILILVILSIVLAFVDAVAPVRPSWVLNAAVVLGFIGVLLMILTGHTHIHISD